MSDYQYVKIANLYGPQGDPGVQGIQGAQGVPGVGIRGDRGPAGLPGANGVATDEAFRLLVENPESQSNSAVVSLISETFGGFSISKVPIEETIFAGESVSKPRPLAADGSPWPGPVYWASSQGKPTYMLARDKWFDLTADTGGGGTTPGVFTPANLDGLQLWSDPTNTGVTDGAAITSYPDRSTGAHTMSTWTQSSTGATTQPVYAATGLNGKPATNLVSRSGFTATFAVAAPTAVVVGVNAQFTGGTPGTVAQYLNTMGNGGKYSISRLPSGTYQASIDDVTYYPFGTIDVNPHSFVLVATATNLSVWVDGTKQLDQTVALSALPSISQLRWGFVGSSGTNTNWKYSGGMILGDGWVNTPASAPSSADVGTYTTWLKKQRGL